MRLKVLLPQRVLVDEEIAKVTAEAANGGFCLLPRHVDFTAALVPGILFFEKTDGRETFLAVDEGTLVKCGKEVLVSTRNAVRGDDLATLEQTVREDFAALDERERRARSDMSKLEANFVRRFLEFRERPGG